jgi:hypothetical protein
VFSSTYDNYLITITGGTATVAGSISLQMDTSTGSTYSLAGTYGNYGINSGVTYNPAATTSWADCLVSGSTYGGMVFISSPFASRATTGWTDATSVASFYKFSLVETSTNSNTGFTLTPGSGTLTGGTINVYGYNK